MMATHREADHSYAENRNKQFATVIVGQDHTYISAPRILPKQSSEKHEAQHAGQCSQKNKDLFNRWKQETALEIGDLVLVRKVEVKGIFKQKFADRWEEKPYVVCSVPDPGLSVYQVRQENGSWTRTLHRSLLLPFSRITAEQHSSLRARPRHKHTTRLVTMLTQKSPVHVSKGHSLLTCKRENSIWTRPEKEFLVEYARSHSRSIDETVSEYWQNCAEQMNQKFPDNQRNGNACKSLAKRLVIIPNSKFPDYTSPGPRLPRVHTTDAGTQTEFPAMSDGQRVSWVFMEPKKELKEGASKTAEALHHTALKRLRQYSPLTESEKQNLFSVIDSGTSSQIARTVLQTLSLGEEIKKLLIFDAEVEARECANEDSALYLKNYESCVQFERDHIICELTNKQEFLAEVLLAISLPSDQIGNTEATEALIPVLGMIYAMLMKQHYYAPSGTQKMLSTALANELTHQKVYQKDGGETEKVKGHQFKEKQQEKSEYTRALGLSDMPVGNRSSEACKMQKETIVSPDSDRAGHYPGGSMIPQDISVNSSEHMDTSVESIPDIDDKNAIQMSLELTASVNIPGNSEKDGLADNEASASNSADTHEAVYAVKKESSDTMVVVKEEPNLEMYEYGAFGIMRACENSGNAAGQSSLGLVHGISKPAERRNSVTLPDLSDSNNSKMSGLEEISNTEKDNVFGICNVDVKDENEEARFDHECVAIEIDYCIDDFDINVKYIPDKSECSGSALETVSASDFFEKSESTWDDSTGAEAMLRTEWGEKQFNKTTDPGMRGSLSDIGSRSTSVKRSSTDNDSSSHAKKQKTKTTDNYMIHSVTGNHKDS